jgi:predicted amidohydrolase YtcJ
VTDATPDLDADTCALLRNALPQRVHLLGDPVGGAPVKVVLADSGLPDLDALVARLRDVRPRPVAVHCVSRAALVLLLVALDEVGRVPGDRVEHAALVAPDLLHRLPPVVTQPGFLPHRGDDYLRDLPADDVEDLYRFGSLVDAGVPVVASSDAPYGPLDPWQVLAAARDRRTSSGRVVGPGERVPTAVCLEGMLRPLEDVTAPARRVEGGAVADLVLLAVPRAEALRAPSARHVRATWVGGRLVSGDVGQ